MNFVHHPFVTMYLFALAAYVFVAIFFEIRDARRERKRAHF